MTAVLGKAVGGGDIAIDMERLIAGRLLACASSGAGKSWTLRRILEQTHGLVPQIVLDVDDEFHTLREKYDYVIAGRGGGDCPADLKSAKLLARRLMELNVSAVIGIFELKKHERQIFVRRFLESLISAPRSLWGARLVVVDEAHIFAPQKSSAEAREAVVDLAARGRKRGLIPLYATQRLAKLDKDVAAECTNKIVGRCNLKDDAVRAAGELGMTGRDYVQLMGLEDGHFFTVGPALSRTLTEVVVGPVKTTHPRPGQHAAPAPPPRSKVRAILAQLADLPAEAEARELSVKELRGEVKSLKLKLAAAEKRAPEPVVETETVYVGADQVALGNIAKSVGELENLVGDIDRAQGMLERGLAEVRVALELEAESDPTPRRPRAPAPKAKPNGARRPGAVAKLVPSKQTPSAPADDTGITGPEQKLLDAAAWAESIGITEPTNAIVAWLAGYSARSSSYRNPRSSLIRRGLISYPGGGRVALTDEGRGAANIPETALTNEDLQQRVLEKLTGPERKLLENLIEAYPQALTNDQLAERAGYSATSSSYRNPRSTLRTLGACTYPSQGEVRAADMLFPERSWV